MRLVRLYQIAKAMGVDEGTIRNDTAENSARKERAELVLLAINSPFTLYERAGCSTAQWRSLKLERLPREAGKKNNWWLGWSVNGERLARNADAAKLTKHHPGIRQWVIRSLRAQTQKKT